MRSAMGGALLIFVGLLSIALMPAKGGAATQFDIFAVGYLIGSVFGHTVAAGAWSAWGPGRAYVRIPLAILWCLLLWGTVGVNVCWLNGLNDGAVIVIMAACIAAIGLAVQVPYWLLRWMGRLSLQRPPTERVGVAGGSVEHAAPPQYGIRQLLIFTTLVAVLFGAGRAALTLLAPVLNQGGYHESAAFGFLAVAAVLLSLPLIPSILLPRHAALAVAGILLLTALATWWELPLYNQILGGGGGPQFMHFVWINCFTAAWILLLAGWVRWSGYCFCRSRQAVP